MAQPEENIHDIGAPVYLCGGSDGNCSPLSREELRQLIEQEFEDAMEVRIWPCHWHLWAVGLGSVKPGSPMWVYRTPGSLGKAQMPSKPRIYREKERMIIDSVPAACRARCGEQHKPQCGGPWGWISALRLLECS